MRYRDDEDKEGGAVSEEVLGEVLDKDEDEDEDADPVAEQLLDDEKAWE